jgi:hypothetical protein
MVLLSCRYSVLVACLTSTCVAYGQQQITFGVKGGGLLDLPRAFLPDESKRYGIGASVEYRLFGGFAVEADFLYRYFGRSYLLDYGQFRPSVPGQVSLLSVRGRNRSDVFEVPVLGKYYFLRDKKVQPFAATGYSFRKILVGADVINEVNQGDGTVRIDSSKQSFWTPFDIGATVGAGVRWKVGRVSLLPEIRYTRWGGTPHPDGSPRQTELLLGITF